MLLRARSFLVPFAVSTRAGKEHLVPFAVLARAGKERLGAVCSFNSCRQGAFWCRLLGSGRRGALLPCAI
ncbi:hypothetical protein ACFX2C_034619 [Malus domestica]